MALPPEELTQFYADLEDDRRDREALRPWNNSNEESLDVKTLLQGLRVGLNQAKDKLDNQGSVAVATREQPTSNKPPHAGIVAARAALRKQ